MRGKNTKKCPPPTHLSDDSKLNDSEEVHRPAPLVVTSFTDDSLWTVGHTHPREDRAWVQSPSLIAHLVRPPSDLELFTFATPIDQNSRYLIYRCKPLVVIPGYPHTKTYLYSSDYHQRDPLPSRMVLRLRFPESMLVPLASRRPSLPALRMLHGQRLSRPCQDAAYPRPR
jgi:hypothetical protein